MDNPRIAPFGAVRKPGGVPPMDDKKKLTIDLTVVYLLNLALILLAQLG